MYVFTQHDLTAAEAPIVCVFEHIPLFVDLCRNVAVLLPETDERMIRTAYGMEGIPGMLSTVETRLGQMRAAGEWPARCTFRSSGSTGRRSLCSGYSNSAKSEKRLSGRCTAASRCI
jgi:hypothetical protein